MGLDRVFLIKSERESKLLLQLVDLLHDKQFSNMIQGLNLGVMVSYVMYRKKRDHLAWCCKQELFSRYLIQDQIVQETRLNTETKMGSHFKNS